MGTPAHLRSYCCEFAPRHTLVANILLVKSKNGLSPKQMSASSMLIKWFPFLMCSQRCCAAEGRLPKLLKETTGESKRKPRWRPRMWPETRKQHPTISHRAKNGDGDTPWLQIWSSCFLPHLAANLLISPRGTFREHQGIVQTFQALFASSTVRIHQITQRKT